MLLQSSSSRVNLVLKYIKTNVFALALGKKASVSIQAGHSKEFLCHLYLSQICFIRLDGYKKWYLSARL